MEIVSSKLEMKGLVASTRLERKDTSPPARRWNAGTTVKSHSIGQGMATPSRAGSSRRVESTTLGTGKSLMSLKAYYRKLRVFKGTVKALINLRRFPTLLKPSGGADALSDAGDRVDQRRFDALGSLLHTTTSICTRPTHLCFTLSPANTDRLRWSGGSRSTKTRSRMCSRKS